MSYPPCDNPRMKNGKDRMLLKLKPRNTPNTRKGGCRSKRNTEHLKLKTHPNPVREVIGYSRLFNAIQGPQKFRNGHPTRPARQTPASIPWPASRAERLRSLQRRFWKKGLVSGLSHDSRWPPHSYYCRSSICVASDRGRHRLSSFSPPRTSCEQTENQGKPTRTNQNKPETRGVFTRLASSPSTSPMPLHNSLGPHPLTPQFGKKGPESG
jgi:hypothetical protein